MFLGLLGIVALWMCGWGTETAPRDQLLRDASQVLVGAGAGTAAGALLAWGMAGKRWFWIHMGGAAGLSPAAVMATAYFTDAY